MDSATIFVIYIVVAYTIAFWLGYWMGKREMRKQIPNGMFGAESFQSTYPPQAFPYGNTPNK